MKNIKYSVYFIVLICIFTTFIYYTSLNKQSNIIMGGEVTVLEVGKYTFSEHDLLLTSNLLKYEYPALENDSLYAYSKLIDGYLYKSVLDNISHPISDGILFEEIQRIDKDTQNKDRLQDIKDLFGNTQDYGRLYVLPDFANSFFHYMIFPSLDSENFDAREKAFALLEKLQHNGDVGDTILVRLSFSPEKGFYGMVDVEDGDNQVMEMKKSNEELAFNNMIKMQVQAEAQKYEDEIFSKLDKGEWFSQVIESQESYDLVRWVEKTDAERVVEKISIPKRTSFDFFNDAKKDIPVHIDNPEIKRKLLEMTPGLSELNWN